MGEESADLVSCALSTLPSPIRKVTIALKNILERTFPEEYEKRKQEAAEERQAASLSGAFLPM